MILENYIRPEEKNKIKGLAYYEIIGGIAGIGMTIYFVISGLFPPLILLSFGLYGLSIYSGQQLLNGQMNKGLKLSAVTQYLQIINFAALGYVYQFVAGLLLGIGIDYTTDFIIHLNVSISRFYFAINYNSEILTVGINFFAIYLTYFIDRLKKKIAIDKELFEASQQMIAPVKHSGMLRPTRE